MKSKEDKIEYIPEPKVKLRFNDLLTTSFRFKSVTKSGLLLSGDGGNTSVKSPIMEFQVVVAAGEHSSYSVGDVVKVNIVSFPRKPNKNPHDIGDAGYTTVPPVEFIEDEVYLSLTDRQLKYSIISDKDSLELINEIRDKQIYV